MIKGSNMNVGMLWYDNDPRTTLVSKVKRAAEFYRQKYGLVADMCLVHPSMLAGSPPDLIDAHAGKIAGADPGTVFGKVSIRSTRLIQPGHLWIGTQENN
jgi:hypothetical protein